MAKGPIAITHPDRVLFPRTGFTKADLVRYYSAIAPWLVPHLRGRPVTLLRCPDGVDGEKFYAKNAPDFTPAWIPTFRVPRQRGGEVNYLLIQNAPTLAWCANLAAIELHPFLHRAAHPDRPTHVVFDLDPGEGADLTDCIRVALLIRKLLMGLDLVALPKLSGSKGLQIYVPLNTPVTYTATGLFAKAVAELLERREPRLVVSLMTKSRRRGRVLIDWSQNAGGKTTVAAYSVRAKRAEPWVSMPVTWLELQRARRTGKTTALQFSPSAALQRVKRKGDLFALLLTLRQKLPEAFIRLKNPVGSRAGSPEGRRIGGSASRKPRRSEPPGPRSSDPLARYQVKRDFTRTAEPAPRAAKPVGRTKTPRFVIQKHAASHLHYDFRLEMEGTLKSWAVPKGVPPERGVKRAAFAVEDHPLGYLKFEGTIPKGEYGGGTVMVWDLGTYELLGGSLEEGDLKLRLQGSKLVGEWHLFRIRRDERGKDVWLIMKSGTDAEPISARSDDRSVLSGLSMAGIAARGGPTWKSNRKTIRTSD